MVEETKIKKVNKWNEFWKSFFLSVGKDIKHLFTKRIFKVIGFIIMYLVPIAFILINYLVRKPNSWGISLVAIPVVIIIIMVYWGSFRSWLNGKLVKMELENTLEKGKHLAFIVFAKLLQITMVILPFLVCYFLFIELEKLSFQVSQLFLFIIICQIIGGMFILGDTILNLNK